MARIEPTFAPDLDLLAPFSSLPYAPWMHSFRDQLTFSTGYAISRSRSLLHRLLREHAPDDARSQLASRVVEQLEQAAYEADEGRASAKAEAADEAAWVTRLCLSFGNFVYKRKSRTRAALMTRFSALLGWHEFLQNTHKHYELAIKPAIGLVASPFILQTLKWLA